MLGLVPPWVPIAAAGVLLAALVGGFFALRAAWRAEGEARLAAAVNGATVKTMSEQAEINHGIAQKLDALTAERATTMRETIREIYIQPSSDACRQSDAMRALNGRLHWRPGGQGGGAAAARPPVAAVPPAGR